MGKIEQPIKNDDNGGPDIQSVIFLENPVVEGLEVTHTVLTTEFLDRVAKEKHWLIVEELNKGIRTLDIYQNE